MRSARHSSRDPLVTAIVSTYNSASFLRGCLDSLGSQSILDRLEVCVVVSGSEEDEWAIARECESRFPNLVLVRTAEREGLYTAWNRAIHLARGQFITNSNTDDRLHPRALERLAATLLHRPDAGLVYGDCLQTELASETLATTQATEMLEARDYCHWDLLRYCFVGPCPMWRRSVHDQVGDFDERYRSAADYDFWLRLAEHYPILHLRETVGLYLDQPGSLAHLQVGKDETRQILYERRSRVNLSRLFDEPQLESDPHLHATALCAMADLCLEGPWPLDYELALEFLQRAHELHPTPQTTNNANVLRLVTQGLPVDSPVMIRTRHSIVDRARQVSGVDPGNVPSLDLPCSIGKEAPPFHPSACEGRLDRSPSILMIQNEHPLDPDGPNGGAEMALIHLARALSRQGCRVTVAAPMTAEEGSRDRVRYVRIPGEYDYRITLAAHAGDYDTLIVSNRGDVSREAGRRGFENRLLWLHVNVPWATHVNARELGDCADRIVCVSEFQRSRFASEGADGSRIDVIPNGTDPSVFYPRPVKRDAYRICCAGALVPLKGVHVLLEAFRIIRRSLPGATLDVFGSADMWGEREYIDATRNDPAVTGVTFHGKVSQDHLAVAYSQSALTIIPSRIELGETFGLVSVDAQACACPVLTTPCGGLVNTVEDGLTGRILKDDSAESIAEAAIAMLTDPIALRQMGERGRRRVLERFTWEKSAMRFLTLIGEISSEPATRLAHQTPVVMDRQASARLSTTMKIDP